MNGFRLPRLPEASPFADSGHRSRGKPEAAESRVKRGKRNPFDCGKSMIWMP